MLDLTDKYTFLDGALGTRLQAMGLTDTPELYNFTNPEVVINIHKSYVSAGSDIIYTNTFGANDYKLKNTGYSADSIIKQAISNAKQAVKGTKTLVAQSIGPIGKLLYPLGELDFEEAYEIFKNQVLSGKDDVGLFVIETMTDLLEMKCALLAVKENCNKPVFCSMSFEANGKTFLGVDPICMARTLEGLGATAVGLNCSVGPDLMYETAKKISSNCNIPVFVKPNAGLPDPVTGNYNITPSIFTRHIQKLAELGITTFGACCGSDENFIKQIISILKDKRPAKRNIERRSIVCSDRTFVDLDNFNIIGERLNPTGKKMLKQALIEGNYDYLVEQATLQAENNANILDLNAGLGEINEGEVLKNAILKIQGNLSIPLQIDSTDWEVLSKSLRVYKGIPIINSTTCEQSSLERIIPIAKKYGAYLICLTIDENGLKTIVTDKVSVIEKAINTAKKLGYEKDKLIVDCLVLTASTNQADITSTLDGVKRMSEVFNLKTTLGISNVSFGLPNRPQLNASFLTMAMHSGLSMCIINPCDTALMDSICACNVLLNRDKSAVNYISRFSQATSESVIGEIPLNYAILKGLNEKVSQIVSELLDNLSPLEVVQQHLLPALDIVGDKYESGSIYLPELIKASESAKKGFELVQHRIKNDGSQSVTRGKIALATVKGDIHDIGKNIVKVVLENYGYEIIDLGFDVEPESVLKVVLEQGIKCVGLSALMTTTLKSMRATIALLKQKAPDCKIMVGGAVLTEEFALSIGADFYAKDAKTSADIAKSIM